MKPRVLIANIFFAPAPFGGATIVTEHMARLLQDSYDWDVVVLTSIHDPDLLPYMIRRYQTNGIDVIGVKLPDIHPYSETSWSNPEFERVLEKILDRVEPDVIHLHSIQNMGAGLIDVANKHGIPVAVTAHDCWFLCERQFMINHAGRYCHQTKIDPKVCRFCVPDFNATLRRTEGLRTSLQKADLVLYPSEFHRQLHVANGVSERRSKVNKNGVKMPEKTFSRVPNPDPVKHKIRFGFVGGPGPIKGASILAKAFKRIKRTDYEVRVVDAATNVRQSWRFDPVWQDIPGTVTFVPAYNQDTMDAVFAEMDVLLFPSQWKESFGLTVREAMVRGVWVVATDAGGLSEDCIDGVNSTVIAMDGNVETLKDVITHILDNPLTSQLDSSHIKSIADQASELDGYLRSITKHNIAVNETNSNLAD